MGDRKAIALRDGDMAEDRRIIKPNSPEEWELEQRMFHAANDPTLPENVRKLIGDLWQALCFRDPEYAKAILEHEKKGKQDG
jgi:hypothetical protein